MVEHNFIELICQKVTFEFVHLLCLCVRMGMLLLNGISLEFLILHTNALYRYTPHTLLSLKSNLTQFYRLDLSESNPRICLLVLVPVRLYVRMYV